MPLFTPSEGKGDSGVARDSKLPNPEEADLKLATQDKKYPAKILNEGQTKNIYHSKWGQLYITEE